HQRARHRRGAGHQPLAGRALGGGGGGGRVGGAVGPGRLGLGAHAREARPLAGARPLTAPRPRREDHSNMANTPADPRDRHAYLEEQIERQRRGEPIDVEWVRAELERVRRQQVATQARTRRQLVVLTVLSAVLMAALWIGSGGLYRRGEVLFV